MATFLKRSSKQFERSYPPHRVSSSSVNSGSATSSSSSSSSSEPSPRELICPLCGQLLREPVTLPCCTHNLCLGCLNASLQQLDLKNPSSSRSNCPLCGLKLGSWLGSRKKPENLVNTELWKFIRQRYPDEQAAAGPLLIQAAAAASRDNDALGSLANPEYMQKKLINSAGIIRKEYEAQVQVAEEEMRRQRERERLANEALIRKIQEQEKQQKFLQLAQEQLLAKTLAKNEVMGQNKSKLDIYNSKLASNQKVSRSKDATDMKKQNVLSSKIRSDRYTSNVKSGSSKVQRDSGDLYRCQKSVPIHNAVTRVVTHQNRLNQLHNSAFSAVGDFVSTSTNIFGLQTKEELHVPSDVINSKKKKLGIEVCVTNVEGEERIGSAESAGSHDSINQEIHHFKPIKALPRTPLRITLDGRQIDPKLIRVLPVLKRASNAELKPPTPTHPKKVFGCSWSAFKRILKHHVQPKEFPTINHPGTKKTDKKAEQMRNVSKSSRTTAYNQLSEANTAVSFDTNKNYTKSLSKTINGTTKVSKKLNLEEQAVTNTTEKKNSKRAPKVKNGQLLGKHKLPTKQKVIEIVDIDDDDNNVNNEGTANKVNAKKEVSNTHTDATEPISIPSANQETTLSPFLDIVENIAERIKRRKTARTVSNTENIQNVSNQVATTEKSQKVVSKKSTPVARNQKTKKPSPPVKPKVRTKIEKVTTLTSQIKRLAARSSKKPRYTEDSESEDEYFERRRLEEQLKLEANEAAELQRSLAIRTPQPSVKKPRKPARSKKSKSSIKKINLVDNIETNDIKTAIQEIDTVEIPLKDRSSKRVVTYAQEDSESDQEDKTSLPIKKSSKERSSKRSVAYVQNQESDQEDAASLPPNKPSKARASKRLVNYVQEDSESDQENVLSAQPKKPLKNTKNVETADEETLATNKLLTERASKRPITYAEEDSDQESIHLSSSKKSRKKTKDLEIQETATASLSSKRRASKRPVTYAQEDSDSDQGALLSSKKLRKKTSNLGTVTQQAAEKLSKERSSKRPVTYSQEEFESGQEDNPILSSKKSLKKQNDLASVVQETVSEDISIKERTSERPVIYALEDLEHDQVSIPLSSSKKSRKKTKGLEPVVEEASIENKTLKESTSKQPVSNVKENSEPGQEDASSLSSQKPQKTTTKNKQPKQSKKRSNPVKKVKKTVIDETDEIPEQERLKQLEIQERKDLELALQLQERFNAMERVAGRTRRGAAVQPPSPVLDDVVDIRSQKKTVK